MAIYAILTMFADWGEIIGGLGMGTLVVKNALEIKETKTKIDLQKFVTSIVIYRTVGMVIFTSVIILFSDYIAVLIFADHKYSKILKYVAVVSFFMAVSSTFSHVQTSFQYFHSNSKINVITFFAQKLFCVIGFFSYGLEGFITGHLVGTILGICLRVNYLKGLFVREIYSFTDIWKQSRSYLGLKVVRSFVDQIDKPLIGTFLGAEGLANYHIVRRLYDNLYQLLLAVVVPLGVKFGEIKTLGHQELQRHYEKGFVVSTFMIAPICTMLFIVSSPLVELYAGAKYEEAGKVLALFGFTIIASLVWQITREASLRLLLPSRLFIQYTTSAFVTSLSYLVLLPILREVGVPIAMGLGFIAGSVPLIKYLKTQCNLIFPLKEFLIALGGGVFSFSAVVPVMIVNESLPKLIVGTLCVSVLALLYFQKYAPTEIVSICKKIKICIVKEVKQ
ncbi:hypothetical protein DESUT3_28690 [Desulfuromonas versatilis]|uniref:Polysaccharide biosynthesis protein n=2 Tax=Desulfuromonas versatilis TaxID=2802975 RepID=A0ABM8HXG0_9BACT|nr:hypothetical protein DESUT3_28690 [Desulfuromonas versatilis]